MCYVLDMVMDTGYNQEWGVVFGHSGEIYSPKVEADPCIEILTCSQCCLRNWWMSVEQRRECLLLSGVSVRTL